jgi:hypothetical protein
MVFFQAVSPEAFRIPSLKREISCKRACYQFGANSFSGSCLREISVTDQCQSCRAIFFGSMTDEDIAVAHESQRARRCHSATAQTSAYFTLVPCIHPRITVSPTPQWFTLSSEMFMYIYIWSISIHNYIHHAAVSNFYMAHIKNRSLMIIEDHTTISGITIHHLSQSTPPTRWKTKINSYYHNDKSPVLSCFGLLMPFT